MKHEVIQLDEIFEGLKANGTGATLHTYIPSNSQEIDMNRKKPNIILCPGGGYGFTSDREAEPVALRFMAQGYNAFVLRYSVAPCRYPQQLLELSAAVAYVRRQCEVIQGDPEQVSVCGFSAGGHLAGSLGVLWQENFIQEQLGLKPEENKPNRLILSYPVITGGEFAHKGSFDNLLGPEASEIERAQLSLEKRVSTLTPPTFIWHTYQDAAVPVKNSLLFAEALTACDVPFELHIYTKGGHGLSLADASTAAPNSPWLINPHVESWFKLVIEWLAQADLKV